MDLLAIDNALVDVLFTVSDEQLARLPLVKGICNFPSDDELERIYARLDDGAPVIAPGGSAANVATLMARLGSATAFCDAVGNDEYGILYEKDLAANGVTPLLAKAEARTGTATTFITPDAQRTFAVHLGASLLLKPDDLPLDEIRRSKVLYVTGYVLEPPLRDTVLRAVRAAKDAGNIVALDLSDPGVVHRQRDWLRAFVKDHVDIVFANEHEAEAFTGKPAREALREMSAMVQVAIIKIGEKGCYIHRDRTIHVPAHVVDAIDTTGAGDAFAAGFLHAWLLGKPLDACGDLGSLLASKVIQQVGARLTALPETEIRALLG